MQSSKEHTPDPNKLRPKTLPELLQSFDCPDVVAPVDEVSYRCRVGELTARAAQSRNLTRVRKVHFNADLKAATSR